LFPPSGGKGTNNKLAIAIIAVLAVIGLAIGGYFAFSSSGTSENSVTPMDEIIVE
jgi:flagellar basal body-associated protein FliL